MSTNFQSQNNQSSEGLPGGTALVPSSPQSKAVAVIRQQPEIVKSALRPVDIIHGFRRRWGWAVLTGILLSAITIAVGWFLIPIQYHTDAWLRVATETPNIIFKMNTRDSYLNQRSAQAVLIRSPFVLRTALRSLDLELYPELAKSRDQVDWLAKRIGVSFPGGSEIMSISMSGDNPVAITEMVNAVKDAYMEEVVSVDRENHLRRKNVLEQAYSRNLQQIDKKMYLYTELSNQLGTANSETVRAQGLHKLESLNDLKGKVNSLDSRLRGLDQRIAIMEARKVSLPQEEQLSEEDKAKRQEQILDAYAQQYVRQDPEVARSLQIIANLDARIYEQSKRVKGGENSRSIQRMRDEQNREREAITARAKDLIPTIKEQLRQQIAQGKSVAPPTAAEKIQALIDDAKLEQSVLTKERETVFNQFTEAAQQAEKLDTYSSELESRKIELDRLKEITNRMGSELQQWQIELEAAPRVSEIRKAEVPRINNIQDKIKKLSMLGIGAFFAGICGVLGLDFLGRRVNSADEINYGLGLRVIGDLPLVSSGLRGGRMNNRVQGMLIESIDNIRTALLHRAEQEGLKVIMVTSSMEKEGKTTVSSQLAASLARSGRRTLLFDGDLRRPGEHRMFEKPLYPGVSEFLRGMVSLEDIVTETRVENLFLAPAGHPHPEALQALARGEIIVEAFARLRDQFDFIIVDSGPILTDSDSLMFGKVLDGLILSILRDVSRLPRIYEACERARAVNVRLLGAVINGISFSKYRSYYRPYTIEVPNKHTARQAQQQNQNQAQ